MKKIISIIAQTFFYVFSICFVFVLLFSILSFLEKYVGLNMPFITILDYDNVFDAQLNIPIVNAIIKYNFSYSILYLWLWLLFYSIYFYTLKEFFKIFTNENLFNNKSLKKLATFFKLNFIPLILNIFIISYICLQDNNENIEEEIVMVIFHAIVGIIVYLYIDVFKKGKQLQDENDLMI